MLFKAILDIVKFHVGVGVRVGGKVTVDTTVTVFRGVAVFTKGCLGVDVHGYQIIVGDGDAADVMLGTGVDVGTALEVDEGSVAICRASVGWADAGVPVVSNEATKVLAISSAERVGVVAAEGMVASTKRGGMARVVMLFMGVSRSLCKRIFI